MFSVNLVSDHVWVQQMLVMFRKYRLHRQCHPSSHCPPIETAEQVEVNP